MTELNNRDDTGIKPVSKLFNLSGRRHWNSGSLDLAFTFQTIVLSIGPIKHYGPAQTFHHT